MTTDRYTIISSDCHAGLPCEEYRPYLDAEFHDRFDDFLADRVAQRERALQFNYDYIMNWETENETGLRGAFDPDQRDKELDADGVAAEVIFADADSVTGMESPPFGAGLSAGAISDPELAYAGARAHNRWLAEFCSHAPERRGGVALVPITHGVEEGVAEIERIAGTPGIRGIMIPTLWRDRLPYNHPDYDPVWAAAASNGLVVHTHSGDAAHEDYGDTIGAYLAEVVWWATRPIAHLLFSGAFERHPDLKFAVTEAAAYWVPDMKWKWDQYLGGGHTTKKLVAMMEGKLSRLPSEYFGDNIFVGASTMSPEEVRRRHQIGCDVVMWGTDYPHPEGTWPHTIDKLESDFRDVPVEDTRQILGGTAAHCYGFDLDALAPIAERIGPSPADLGQDPACRTTPEEIRQGSWWKDEYGLRPPSTDGDASTGDRSYDAALTIR